MFTDKSFFHFKIGQRLTLNAFFLTTQLMASTNLYSLGWSCLIKFPAKFALILHQLGITLMQRLHFNATFLRICFWFDLFLYFCSSLSTYRSSENFITPDPSMQVSVFRSLNYFFFRLTHDHTNGLCAGGVDALLPVCNPVKTPPVKIIET